MTRNRALLLKVGLFGIQDLNRLAPIGDIGYLKDISYYNGREYEMSGLKRDIMKAFDEQREKNGWTVEGGNTVWRCTDHWSHCPEIGLSWSVDSGD